MKGSSTTAVVLAWLVLAPLLLAQQAQAWVMGWPWLWDGPRFQNPNLGSFPPHFRPVVDCVQRLSSHASEYYALVDEGKLPSKKACRSLLHLSSFCQHRLRHFLNLSLHRTKKLRRVCHKKLLKGNKMSSLSPSGLSPSPSPSSPDYFS